MLLQKLFHITTQKKPRRERTTWIIFLLVIILGTSLLLKFWNPSSRTNRSLLTQAPGLVHVSTLEAASTYLPLEMSPPTTTFDAQLFTLGVYTQTTDVFPKGTVTLVYTKNNWRFIEIDYIPERSVEEQLALLNLYEQQKIVLADKKTAWIITRNLNPRCIDYEDEFPNKCEITYQLIFEKNGMLISIAADGEHATVGEMIEMAKSIF